MALRLASRGLGRPMLQARMMSTLAEKVTTDIAKLKGLAAGSDSSDYTAAAFDKDLAAGKPDLAKVQEALAFSGVAQKLLSKMVNEMNAAKNAPPEPTIDFAEWSTKIETPGLVEEIKAIYEKELVGADFEAKAKGELESMQSALKTAFSGSDGLYEKARAEEKAADAGLLQCVADLELLEKQIGGVSEQTIAEILEMEPELRKELEAELDASNWAP